MGNQKIGSTLYNARVAALAVLCINRFLLLKGFFLNSLGRKVSDGLLLLFLWFKKVEFLLNSARQPLCCQFTFGMVKFHTFSGY